MSQENAQNSEIDASLEITPEMQSFYQRADAIIGVANSQLGPEAHSGQVGASLLYAAARYSASVASIGFVKGDDFAKEKDDIVEFYVKQYRQMLSDNLTDYAQNFDKYVDLNQEGKNAE
ncbi:MAG: DUF3144 domain-containing protein [Psychrobacter sp.]|uniref:DUF3144 domain-containing protein n=1 Tax=Psychrobacter glacincola TaxID=56810 RepID=A0ABW1W5F1_9GAMM|nr:DUF3144 domain-containing protein [Psychrobacter glacincola]MBP6496186.1 DUF3144 domain-containing protein [Psychrobacter sp.]HAR75547.1 DUF3144 domain-containing protein [Psychrobacter sp.]|tara:strand:+ start:569 stop:925 length:357 start_codon:yes stop_codon:yes gene_type:complete